MVLPELTWIPSVLLWSGGPPGEGHPGVPAGAPATCGLDMTEVWSELRLCRRSQTGMFDTTKLLFLLLICKTCTEALQCAEQGLRSHIQVLLLLTTFSAGFTFFIEVGLKYAQGNSVIYFYLEVS